MNINISFMTGPYYIYTKQHHVLEMFQEHKTRASLPTFLFKSRKITRFGFNVQCQLLFCKKTTARLEAVHSSQATVPVATENFLSSSLIQKERE